jgi:hypothetical protein
MFESNAGAPPVNPEAVSYEPTDADLAWYAACCREREERLWSERVEAAIPPLAAKLREVAYRYLDDPDDDLVGLGGVIWELAAEADALEARDWEQYQDRRDCMRDANGR